jgi:hypothetical protein
MMTRAEHLQWSKDRALAYLPGDLTNATASFICDLDAHPELQDHLVKELIAMHIMADLLNERTCRELIVGTR